MKRIIASDWHNDTDILVGFAGSRVRMPVVSDETRSHERHVASEYTWPALPKHLQGLPDARAMVRHWVRTDYQWRL